MKKRRSKGRRFVREVIYTTGEFVDIDIFPVFQPQGKRRSKCNPTSEIQQQLNQKNAERKLIRLIHNNFTEEDIALTLTYKVQPENITVAGKLLSNFLRRLKGLRKKLGLEPLKYITVTEVGKRNGRIHHHLILSGGIDRDVLEELWALGFANSQRLQFGQNGVTGLAMYFVKDRQTYRRWNSSRNLERPEPQIQDGKTSLEELDDMETAHESSMFWQYIEARYPYELTEFVFIKNAVNKGCYIHIEMRRRQ